MPFIAPEADIQFDPPAKGGFVAPLTDTPVKGFIAPEGDIAEAEAAHQAALSASIDPTAFAGSVNQPSQFGSGYSLDSPNLLNADDWGFTTALAGPSGPAAKLGQALNAAGQVVKGGAEASLFWRTGQPQLAAQEVAATASNISPALKQRLGEQGIDTSDPYEDARQKLPVAERIASDIGPGLLQSAPQLALTAVQPELGAASFGFTPQGFDPVQAAAMMIAPEGGKLVGGLAKELAAKAGISDAQALDTINSLGGGVGAASLISTPTVYQIAQMNPGPERNEAIQGAASNAILASLLGSIGARDGSGKPNAETAGAPGNSFPAVPPTETPVSGKIEYQPGVAEDFAGALWARLLGQNQQMVNVTPDVDQIIRNVFPVEEQPGAVPDQIPQYGINGPGRDLGLNDESAGTPQALASAHNPNGNEVSANPPVEKPISQRLDDLTATVKDIRDALTANQISRATPSQSLPIETGDEIFTERTPQLAQDNTDSATIFQPRFGAAETVPGPAMAIPPTSEPYYVLSTDGTGGLDHQTTQAGVNSYLRWRNRPPQVQIVNDPDWTHNGYGVRGTVQDGKIIVNRAFIDSADTLQQVLREEHNHALLSSKEGRDFIRYAAGSNLGDDQYSALAKQYPRQSGESDTDWQARLADEFIAKAASENIPIWRQIVERVKTWLAGKGIGTLSDEETARAIMRALKAGKTAAEFAPRLLDVSRSNADAGWWENDNSTHGDSDQESGNLISRYNLTDEPLEGMSQKRTADGINELFGTKQLPARILVTRNRRIPWKATHLRNGSIAVNAAKISSPEEAQEVVLLRGLSLIWHELGVQRAWNYVKSNLTTKELTAASNGRKTQGLPTDSSSVLEEAAIARVLNLDGRDRIVENFHNAIRTAMNQKFRSNLPATAHPLLEEAAIRHLRERSSQEKRTARIPVMDPAKARPLRNVLKFKGMEVRAVRSLSHLDEATLREMAQYGSSGTTKNGKRISLHHLAQNPAGPLVEMPRGNNKISNIIQHPFGNTAGSGLTRLQRESCNDWRNEYWRWRARQELTERRKRGP